MKVVFVSDTFHHHQKGVADALFEMTDGTYCFITTLPLREERKRMGFKSDYPEYVFDASSRTKEVWGKAQKMIDDADVVILGSAPFSLLRKRLSERKITFRYSERLWKQYKHYLKTPCYIFDNIRTRDCWMLCSSAFTAHDYNAMGAFRGRCYKWGYFTGSQSSMNHKREEGEIIHLMWCSRFLDWKHPELPIFLAQRLKEKDYSFVIDMYGTGRYLDASKKLALNLRVNDVVNFCGNVPNNQIIQSMRTCDIFLFTSDRAEGWGVVANESMSNGCALVASDEIGSIPYLVTNNENGCTFRSPSRFSGFSRLGCCVDEAALNSLVDRVEWLINNPDERCKISDKAYQTIYETWNPRKAASNLLSLIDDLSQGRETRILIGPCSKA